MLKNHFWELRMTLFDSHVDEKHIGFYKSKKKANKAKREQNGIAGINTNGHVFKVKHTFDD